MLKKSSVFTMMLLVAAASLIGISGIGQYVEGLLAPQQKSFGTGFGTVTRIRMFDSSAGTPCTAALQISRGLPNNLGLGPGTTINLLAPSEHFCTLFVLSKVGRMEIGFEAQNIKATALPPDIQTALVLPQNYPYLYSISEVDI